MTQIAKTEKPTGVFWYAFLAEKCILRRFCGQPQKIGVQLARYESFTQGAKTGRLYDTGDFTSGGTFGHFERNLLKNNRMAFKMVRVEGGQKRVTYNNMPCAEFEKQALLGRRGRGIARCFRRAHLFCSAGFQPAVSPASSRQSLGPSRACGLEIRDTAGWKPALRFACAQILGRTYSRPTKI
jgi:hypothetical protein